jgi:hypothetical protein
MTMKALALAVLVLSTLSFHQSFADSFPTGPAAQLTPGKLCDHPDATRYPEKIAYCTRDVTPETKRQIIEEYDRKFGYTIESMPRSDFKIDHYIPLCVGGSNDISNLWPQHVSVYTVTDPLEEAVCEKMSDGKLLQKDAVKLIVEAKTHLDETPTILAQVNAL